MMTEELSEHVFFFIFLKSKPLLLFLKFSDSSAFSIYRSFAGSRRQPPFQFTCYLQDLYSPPRPIYMLFTASLLNLHIIYRVDFFRFTCYLHDLCLYTFKFTASSL